AGPGAESRTGITSLDPQNGMPFAWNPTRDRGVGVFDMLTTSNPAGLWIGDDTNIVGGEFRERVAFFPLTGGETVPAWNAGQLPGTVYSLGVPAPANPASPALYRVNAGGPALASSDDGPDWAADTAGAPSSLHNSGSSTSSYNPVGSIGSAVPPTTPTGLFA